MFYDRVITSFKLEVTATILSFGNPSLPQTLISNAKVLLQEKSFMSPNEKFSEGQCPKNEMMCPIRIA